MGYGGHNQLLDGPGECRRVEALPPNEGREAETELAGRMQAAVRLGSALA